jgi:hypothetical protein
LKETLCRGETSFSDESEMYNKISLGRSTLYDTSQRDLCRFSRFDERRSFAANVVPVILSHLGRLAAVFGFLKQERNLFLPRLANWNRRAKVVLDLEQQSGCYSEELVRVLVASLIDNRFHALLEFRTKVTFMELPYSHCKPGR